LKDNDNGLVESEIKAIDGIDHLPKISKVVDDMGIKMPDLVATGDLTVDKSDTIKTKKELIMVDDGSEKKVDDKKLKKKDFPLPLIGDVFMHKGYEYKVIYINEGKHRFSCESYKGDY